MSYSINDLIYIDRDTGDTSFTGNILPIGSNQFSLGSSNLSWKDLNLSGNLNLQGGSFNMQNSTFSGDLLPSSSNTYNIGSSNLPWKDMYLSGNMHSETVTTSNLVVLNAYSTDYQIAPIRQVYYITSTPRSTFTLTTNGYFGGNACNVQVFIDNKKLTYYSDTINNYQLAVSYDYDNTKTNYTITLAPPAVFGNLVDITIWPKILKESLPNPMRMYQYVNIEYSTPITRPYQLPPIRQVFYVSSASQSIFDVVTPGVYGGSANNVQVFVGQSLLSYYSSIATDYTLNITYIGTDTVYTITLTNPVQYASVVDIMIWPTIISGSTLVGSIYQTINTGNSQWQIASGSDIYYYTTGNVGIGTDNPNLGKLVVGGNMLATGNIVTNNNIGIGTTNPASALHVIGNIFTTGTVTASNVNVIGDFVTLNTITSNTEQMVITNDGTGPALKVTQTGDQPVAEFYDNESGIALFVGNNGNVGIGTTVPRIILDINSTTGIRLPSGTTALRPNHIIGLLRYNTTFNRLEITNGSEWSMIKGIAIDDINNVYITNRLVHFDASSLTSYDGSGNTWYDLSGNTINASGTNIIFGKHPPEYFAFNIDANNAYFNLTLTNPAGAWVHSISFWMMLTIPQSSISTRADPFQIGSTAVKSAYSALDISSTGTHTWYFFDNDTNFTYPFREWQWYHLVLTYNGGVANPTNKKLYINNIAVTLTGTSTSALNIAANAVMSIGRDRIRNTAYFPGRIAQFMIYNEVLDVNAVAQNFNAHRARYGR